MATFIARPRNGTIRNRFLSPCLPRLVPQAGVAALVALMVRRTTWPGPACFRWSHVWARTPGFNKHDNMQKPCNFLFLAASIQIRYTALLLSPHALCRCISTASPELLAILEEQNGESASCALACPSATVPVLQLTVLMPVLRTRVGSLPTDIQALFQISDRSFIRVTQSWSLTVVHLDTKLDMTEQLANLLEVSGMKCSLLNE